MCSTTPLLGRDLSPFCVTLDAEHGFRLDCYVSAERPCWKGSGGNLGPSIVPGADHAGMYWGDLVGAPNRSARYQGDQSPVDPL